ncbi:hypothetical protein HOP62_06450 [Halomonas sp. MCCC 1A17488]|uniref:Uncharacterized protein n=1 Tax=Billgrantia sulfidoxydans TaxID=2733484 RepID=A0ABX7W478_9GAMM|nr:MULTISPECIES: hypothetical protein [Halomonas]MCE8015720.1 hypothetical protein [Halomonas sp. MCCC 1A17488]MCG3239053.1 hypothetical protein [Halomonas sp. MCCC 1A17488]QPP50998.1 hypothetical protein I4484_07945 [Halomonas sp. SS10-MC5]QTP54510.1 hypothetical protein HNO51_07355 [Halomonas sulfidoxydans]
MLTSDSMSLLWLTYLGLSLVVLVTGYLGLAFLPRLLRLPITWMVAGILLMPTRFRLPLVEEGEFYTGMAPAVVVAAVALLERNVSGLVSSGLLVGAGALLGIAVGILQAWLLRREATPDAGGQGKRKQNDDESHDNSRRNGRSGEQLRRQHERREPKLG